MIVAKLRALLERWDRMESVGDKIAQALRGSDPADVWRPVRELLDAAEELERLKRENAR